MRLRPGRVMAALYAAAVIAAVAVLALLLVIERRSP